MNHHILRHPIWRRLLLPVCLILLLIAYTQPVSAAVFIINTTADGNDILPGDGICDSDPGAAQVCTLNAALAEANNTPGIDTINFNIPGPGPYTLTPTGVQGIFEAVIVDGTTQPGYAGTPIVEINGVNTGVGSAFALTNTDGVTIRGLAINGFAGGFGVFIDGDSNNNIIEDNTIGTDITGSVTRPNSNGVWIEGDPGAPAENNLIRNNLISGNSGVGVSIFRYADRNIVQNNRIGTNAAGDVPLPNTIDGVTVGAAVAGTDIVTGNTITANTISGNTRHNLYISGRVDGTVISDNLIGTDITGALPLGSGSDGLKTGDSGGNLDVVTGTTVVNNTIVNSGGRANLWFAEGTTGAVASGNRIGTNAAATAGLARGGESGVYLTAPGNTVTSNVIAGNAIDGVLVEIGDGQPASDSRIEGNFIGTNTGGTLPLPNNGSGVRVRITDISGAITGVQITGGNLITFNSIHGVIFTTIANVGMAEITNSEVTSNRIVNNGVHGVFFTARAQNAGNTARIADNTVSGNTIEGNAVHGILLTADNLNEATALVEQNTFTGNTLQNNGQTGIALQEIGAPSPNVRVTDNRISQNRILDNSALGIDLGNNGVTLNDPGDGDGVNEVSNNLQNFPVLLSAVRDGADTVVTGTLNSTSNRDFTLEFFDSAAPDPSGYGEGETYIGDFTGTTDAAGNLTFTATLNAALPDGRWITATTTDDDSGDTSEFSQAIQVTSVDLAVDKVDAVDPITLGETIDYTITVTNNGTATADPVTLVDTLPANVEFIAAAPAGCTEAVGTVTCDLGALAPGATVNVTITIRPLTGGDFTNVVQVVPVRADVNEADNTADETTTVIEPPTATFTPSVTLTFTSTPTATNTVPGVPTVTNTPVNPDAPTNTPTVFDPGAPTNTPTATAVTFVASSTPVPPTQTPVPTATRTPAPTATNTASPTATFTTSPTSTATLTATHTLTPTASLTVTATSTATLTSSPTVTPTPTTALTGTPSVTPVQSASSTITLEPALNTTPLIGYVAANQVDAAGRSCVKFGAIICRTGGNAGGSITSVGGALNVNRDMPFVSKIVTADFVLPGGEITYAVQIVNPTRAAVTNVVVTDVVPSQLEVVSASATSGQVVIRNQTVTFRQSRFAPLEVVTLTILTRLRYNAAPGDILNAACLTTTQNPEETCGVARLLPVTQLPGTGESPAWRGVVIGVVVVVVLMLVTLVGVARHRRGGSAYLRDEWVN